MKKDNRQRLFEVMQKIDNSFTPKLNESNLSFSYKGTELPTKEMIDWFSYEFNQSDDTMDSLEQDEFSSKQQKEFFEEFHDELMDLSYMEMLDVYNRAKNSSY
ncbi:MAG: hypothetical protein WC333_01215 [Dehalococcoidia bacterium]|jgi:hypothetical protein